jgi:hypothetical protein
MAAQRQEGAGTEHRPRVQPASVARSKRNRAGNPSPLWRTLGLRLPRSLYLSSGDETRILF